MTTVGWLKAQLAGMPDDARVAMDCGEGVEYEIESVYAKRPNDNGVGSQRVWYAPGGEAQLDDTVMLSTERDEAPQHGGN